MTNIKSNERVKFGKEVYFKNFLYIFDKRSNSLR